MRRSRSGFVVLALLPLGALAYASPAPPAPITSPGPPVPYGHSASCQVILKASVPRQLYGSVAQEIAATYGGQVTGELARGFRITIPENQLTQLEQDPRIESVKVIFYAYRQRPPPGFACKSDADCATGERCGFQGNEGSLCIVPRAGACVITPGGSCGCDGLPVERMCDARTGGVYTSRPACGLGTFCPAMCTDEQPCQPDSGLTCHYVIPPGVSDGYHDVRDSTGHLVPHGLCLKL